MADDGLRERLHAESKVLRDASWSGPAATMMDAAAKLSETNALLNDILPELHDRPELARKVLKSLMNRDPAALSMWDEAAADHDVLGWHYRSRDDYRTYICDGFHPKSGYWMTPIEPNGIGADGGPVRRRCVEEHDLARFERLDRSVHLGPACAPAKLNFGP